MYLVNNQPNEPYIKYLIHQIKHVSKMEYIKDSRRGHIEYWQTPLETKLLRAGDCEDLSLLLIERFRAIHIVSYLSIGKFFNGREYVGHAWVTLIINGVTWNIEATKGFTFPENELGIRGYIRFRTMRYDQTMSQIRRRRYYY